MTDDKYTDFDGNPLSEEDTLALKRLQERVQAPEAEGWRPEVNEVLTGRVLDIDDATSEYGSYPLLVIGKFDGEEVAVHCFHTVLQNRIEQLVEKGRLREGTLISIRYAGQTGEAKGGHDAPHMYKVVVENPTPA